MRFSTSETAILSSRSWIWISSSVGIFSSSVERISSGQYNVLRMNAPSLSSPSRDCALVEREPQALVHAGEALGVKHVEGDRFRFRGQVQPDRDRNEPERDNAAPDRPSHKRGDARPERMVCLWRRPMRWLHSRG